MQGCIHHPTIFILLRFKRLISETTIGSSRWWFFVDFTPKTYPKP